MGTRRVVLKETDSFVCIPFTKFSSSGKDAPSEIYGLTNGETFLLELVQAELTPDPQAELRVVTTPDTLLECDVVIDSALGEQIDTLVTAGDCSIIEGLVAADICSRDGLSTLFESLADDESVPS